MQECARLRRLHRPFIEKQVPFEMLLQPVALAKEESGPWSHNGHQKQNVWLLALPAHFCCSGFFFLCQAVHANREKAAGDT